MSGPNDISAVEFGRVLGHLEAIQADLRELKTRTVFRLDNLEDRMEVVEQRLAERTFPNKIVDRLIAAVLGAGAAALLLGLAHA